MILMIINDFPNRNKHIKRLFSYLIAVISMLNDSIRNVMLKKKGRKKYAANDRKPRGYVFPKSV